MSVAPTNEVYVVLIWVNAGQLETLHDYERKAAPIIERHGGQFKTVMSVSGVGDGSGFDRPPDEVHVLEFPDSEAFGRYRADPDSDAIGHLRDASVEHAIFLQGNAVALFT